MIFKNNNKSEISCATTGRNFDAHKQGLKGHFEELQAIASDVQDEATRKKLLSLARRGKMTVLSIGK